MPWFAPPVSYENPYRCPPGADRGCSRLFRYFGPLAVGYTVVKEDGVYATVQSPDNDRLLAADRYYLGGHWTEVDEAEAADLEAAGYMTYATRPSGALVHGVEILQ